MGSENSKSSKKSSQNQSQQFTQQINNQQQQQKLKKPSNFTSTISEQQLQDLKELQLKENQITEYNQEQVKNFNENQQQENQNSINISDCIELKLIPRFNTVKISKKDSQTMPVMISLDTKAPENMQSKRAPIDLVCVIDDSGSMYGKKAQLVRQSLKYLLKILNEDDRICLVCYDSNSKVLTPFLKNTPENKEQLKAAIKYIQGRGSTNTTSGMEKGLWMLQNRKQQNPVACMFLLSDGVDNVGSKLTENITNLLENYPIQQQFTINAYGYGDDHNPEQMKNISTLKNGNFYYIENLKKVSDWFILSLSGLLTVLGENIEIRLRQEQEYQITKYYGDDQLWDKDNIIHLPHLVQNNKKEYLIEIKIPKFKNDLKDEEKQKKVLSVQLFGQALEGKVKEIEIDYALNLTLLNENEQINQEDQQPNEKLEVTYYRAKGGEIIGEACKLADQRKYDEANKLLDDLIAEIDQSEFKDANGIQFIKSDAIKSKNYCQPQIFEQKGKAFMYKKNRDHINRQASLCNLEDWDQNQQDMYENFKNDEYNLSDNSVIDSGNDSDGEDQKLPKLQLQNRFSGSLNGSFQNQCKSDDSGSDSQISYRSGIQQQQIQQRRNSQLSLPRKNSFIVNDDDDDDEDLVEEEMPQNNQVKVSNKRSSVLQQKN